MARLQREAWYDIARDVDWTLAYATDDAVFPEWLSGGEGVPREAWAAWDEPYKCAYPEYVATQREKEASVQAVRSALQRSNVFETLDEGWKSTAKAHFGAVSLIEYLAVFAELRMARFGLSPRWRNIAVFGALDEIRHAQMDLEFAHEFVRRDPQYDWAQKAYHTDNWAIMACRVLFDGMVMSPSAVDIALQLPFAFETGFTNLQFVALAADALRSGDVSFANMISSTQTDEARHAQQGGPTLELLMEHDPARAQWVVDKTFWGSARLFAILTGPGMDYYTPLEHRRQSYREFMEEWVVAEFVRLLDDYGLRRPWYWDEFMAGLDTWQHALHLGVWAYRPTVWWHPQAGVSRAEREWLREKYPRWEAQFGGIWDEITRVVNDSGPERTLPVDLPWLCNLCQLPIGTATAPGDPRRPVRSYSLTHNGRTHHFCSRPCRRIWWEDKDLLHHRTIVDRLVAGEIQPPTMPGLLAYMGLTPEISGRDAYDYAWAAEYRGGAGSAP